MELNERINALEGELKLLKTEIKKVLIDLREMLNNYENPFIDIEQLKRMRDSATNETDVKRIKMEEKKEEGNNEKGVEENQLQPQAQPQAQPQPQPQLQPQPQPKIAKELLSTGKIDIFTLTQLMKWADHSLATIGKEKLNKIIDLYELTGRLPREIKEVISKIEELSNVTEEKKEVDMKDCILAIYQLDRIITGDVTQTPFLLSEEEIAKWLKM
ncbi:MAG: hypothetical protein ACXQTS_03225 [Candidatus Methanospirareceae archaeon]